MLRVLWALLLVVGLAGCPRPVAARMDALAEPDPIELGAKERLAGRSCVDAIGVVFPGLGAYCDGRKADGAALMSVAAIDLASAIAIPVATGRPYAGGDQLPLIWLQNAYITGWIGPALDRELAKRMLYVPKDTFGELALAPFNGHVLKRPIVWAGTIGLIGGAVLVSALAPAQVRAPRAGVNWFGADLPPGIGWPLTTVTYAYTFEHVAIGEESLFRGMIQSSISRGIGRWGGWGLGTLIFGLSHVTNAVGMPSDEAAAYLLYSVPYITLVGAVLGLAYMDARYSLAASVAMHFWYDFALSLTNVILNPDTSMVAARISLPF